MPNARRTDTGNADRFAARNGGRLLHVGGLGWLTWDGKRWGRDTDNAVLAAGMDTACSIHSEAAALNLQAEEAPDPEARKAVAAQAVEATKWAGQSESRSRIDGMIHLASAHEAMVLAGGAAMLDADPDALNVQNGVLDLKGFTLRPHDPAEHHSKVAGAEFVPGADSDLWNRFLARVIPDADVRHWVQKAAGASLRGRHSEDLFIPWGSGKNGKSVFLHAVRHALGDYAMEAAPELLVRGRGKRSAGDNSAMADLRGRRFVTTIETAEGAKLDEVFVKQVTGEAVMKAKHMHKDWFEFGNQSSVWLATNHKPDVQGTDKAIWERLHLIPFTAFIPPEERDENLTDKLERPENSAAVLMWLVEGLGLFDAEGLRPAPAAVAEATATYREEMDPLTDWLDAEVVADPDGCALQSAVTDQYHAYCRAAGEEPMPAREFNKSMEARGYVRASRRVEGKPERVWAGLTLPYEWHREAFAGILEATRRARLAAETEAAEPRGLAS